MFDLDVQNNIKKTFGIVKQPVLLMYSTEYPRVSNRQRVQIKV